MTKYERELQYAERESDVLSKCIQDTKRTGWKLRNAQKAHRKERGKVAHCIQACMTLPKPWQSYQPKRTRRGNVYARPEINDLHAAMSRLQWAMNILNAVKEKHAERFTDRQKYRQELKALPDKIASLRSLVEIASKKRKTKKEVDPRSKWIEVTPGYFVEKYRVVTYCKTLKTEPIKNVSGGFYVISHQNGYAKFGLKQLHPGSAVPCYAR